MGDIINLLGIAVLLLSVSMPCAPSYNTVEPVAAIQEFIQADAVENELSVNDQTDVVLYEETTVESEGMKERQTVWISSIFCFCRISATASMMRGRRSWSLFRLSQQDI